MTLPRGRYDPAPSSLGGRQTQGDSPMALADRIVVVTGGARGIGRALVEGFLRERSKVVAMDLSWDGEEEFKNEIEGKNGGLTLSADVRDEASIERAFADTM